MVRKSVYVIGAIVDVGRCCIVTVDLQSASRSSHRGRTYHMIQSERQSGEPS